MYSGLVLINKMVMQLSDKKKVIFIGGTAYSGSTFLDMVLANSPDGFSCGEINALFYPYRKHHLNPVCGCGDSACDVWRVVKEGGVKRLYQTIFELYPEVNVIVDSSKDPAWIRNRSNDLREAGIAVEHVLIWKTPEEFFASRSKRGKTKGWEREWVNYHRYYFSRIENWVSLPYKVLVSSVDALEQLCDLVGISFFEGKEEYWNKKHHTLFGNTSAKIHLYDKKSNSYKQCQKKINSSIEKGDSQGITHKAVYYNSSGLPAETIILHSTTKKIREVLSATSMSRGETFSSDDKNILKQVKAGRVYIFYQLLKGVFNRKRKPG